MKNFSRLPNALRRSIKLFLAVFALSAPLLLATNAMAQETSFGDLYWMTEEYYPYNFSENGRVNGISPTLLRLTWKELGEPEYELKAYPWARAYHMAQTLPRTVLFSMARTPEREQMFKWAGPIAHVRFVLTAPKAKGLKISTGTDLKGLVIGTLRDDVGDQLLEPWRDICTIEPVATMDQNLKKLEMGRLDLFSYEENSTRLFLLHEGKKPEDYETVFVLQDVPIYFAFHKDTADTLILRFQKALDRVKQTNAFVDLLDDYAR
ncbi:MAG: ABC transporter substrate-binding protein [Proteobacteria bacterium]|nr:ABC transporter substrate-binding protein [Pseudomonadota bacterium]